MEEANAQQAQNETSERRILRNQTTNQKTNRAWTDCCSLLQSLFNCCPPGTTTPRVNENAQDSYPQCSSWNSTWMDLSITPEFSKTAKKINWLLRYSTVSDLLVWQEKFIDDVTKFSFTANLAFLFWNNLQWFHAFNVEWLDWCVQLQAITRTFLVRSSSHLCRWWTLLDTSFTSASTASLSCCVWLGPCSRYWTAWMACLPTRYSAGVGWCKVGWGFLHFVGLQRFEVFWIQNTKMMDLEKKLLEIVRRSKRLFLCLIVLRFSKCSPAFLCACLNGRDCLPFHSIDCFDSFVPCDVTICLFAPQNVWCSVSFKLTTTGAFRRFWRHHSRRWGCRGDGHFDGAWRGVWSSGKSRPEWGRRPWKRSLLCKPIPWRACVGDQAEDNWDSTREPVLSSCAATHSHLPANVIAVSQSDSMPLRFSLSMNPTCASVFNFLFVSVKILSALSGRRKVEADAAFCLCARVNCARHQVQKPLDTVVVHFICLAISLNRPHTCLIEISVVFVGFVRLIWACASMERGC